MTKVKCAAVREVGFIMRNILQQGTWLWQMSSVPKIDQKYLLSKNVYKHVLNAGVRKQLPTLVLALKSTRISLVRWGHKMQCLAVFHIIQDWAEASRLLGKARWTSSIATLLVYFKFGKTRDRSSRVSLSLNQRGFHSFKLSVLRSRPNNPFALQLVTACSGNFNLQE